MSTELTWRTASTSSEDTEALAEQIGNKLRGGEVIVLVSDLGGGKTTFVRGLARGAGSKDKVSSPSFTISNEYLVQKNASINKLVHFDFYRLSDPGIIANEIAEVIDDKKSVVVVEWAEIVEDVLPKERLTIELVPNGDDSRLIKLKFPDNLGYLKTDT